jgi:hypothetical protein
MSLFDGQTECLFGVAGGAFTELLRWFNVRDSLHKGLPDWSKSIFYWIVTSSMILAGGLLVYIHLLGGAKISAFLALNIGASAPLLLGALAQRTPTISPGSVN